MQSPKGDELKYKVCLLYSATNNEVEYEALLIGKMLRSRINTRPKRLSIGYGSSEWSV